MANKRRVSPFCYICGDIALPDSDRCQRHPRNEKQEPAPAPTPAPAPASAQAQAPAPVLIPAILLTTSPSSPRAHYYLGLLLSPGEPAQRIESNSKEEVETWARVILIKTDKENKHKTPPTVFVYEINEVLVETMTLNRAGRTFTTETPR